MHIGKGFSVACTYSGEVICWGGVFSFDGVLQNGIKQSAVAINPTFSPVNGPANSKFSPPCEYTHTPWKMHMPSRVCVVAIVAGGNSSNGTGRVLATTIDGGLYGWGSNQKGW